MLLYFSSDLLMYVSFARKVNGHYTVCIVVWEKIGMTKFSLNARYDEN